MHSHNYPRRLLLPAIQWLLLSIGVLQADTCVAPPSGLVAWWPGENTGVDVRRRTPATADGATHATGRVGEAFRMVGATDGLGLGTAPLLQREDFTVEGWVQRRDATIVANGGGDRGWFLAFGFGGWGVGLKSDGRLLLSRVGEADVTSPAAVVTDTAFHHVAITRREEAVAFYVDGVPAGTAGLNSRFRFATQASIGRRGDDHSGSFAGLIDELAVYDRALNPAEIATLNTAGSAGKCAPAADLPNDIPVATERWIRGSSVAGHVVQSSDGFSVFGRLRLESSDAGYVSGVDVGSGDLINEPGGEIVVNRGSAGERVIRGNLLNRGAVKVGWDLALDGAGMRVRNEGVWDLNGGSLFLRGADLQLDLAGGSVTGPGKIEGIGVHVRFLDGDLAPVVDLLNSTLEIGPGNTKPGSFVLTGDSSRLRGDIAAGQSVLINGSIRGGHTTVQAPLGFANAGVLKLESRDGGYLSAVQVGPGGLSNRAGGLLISSRGAAGPRALSGALNNEGAFQVDWPITLGAPGAVHINRGTVNIAPAISLSLAGGGQTFRQEAGVLQMDGLFDVSGIRFEYHGGHINGLLALLSSSLALDPAAIEPASFVLTGSSSTFEGNIGKGISVWIRGEPRGNHTTVSVGGFANRGTLLLQSLGGGYTSSLQLSSGSLINETGGQLTVGRGDTGPRLIGGELLNRGTFTVAWPVTVEAQGATHVNRGLIDIQPGMTLAIAAKGQTFRQEAGQLNIGGSLDLTSLNFEFVGGTITGVPLMDGVNLQLTPSATEPASFHLTRSSSRLRGIVHSGQEILIRGEPRGDHTTVVAPGGLVNHGIVRLESQGGGYTSSLSVPAGVLDNAIDGRVIIARGDGGPRTISGQLLNAGRLEVNWPLNLVMAGATHLNRGQLLIAPGMSLTLSGGGQTFRQEAGRIEVGGGLDLTGITLDYVGGEITGAPYLDGVDLRLGPAATAPFFLQLARSSSRLHGDVKSGQTLWIRGDSRSDHTVVVAPEGLANSGRLILESRDGGYTAGLAVVSGILLNQPGGVIEVNQGASGPRPLDVSLVNRGRIEVNWPMTLGHAGLAQRNEGDLVIAAGRSLDLSGANQVFEQTAGTLQIGGTFSVRQGTFRYLGGLVMGGLYMVNSALEFGPGAGPSGSFLTGGNGTRLGGTIPNGATVAIQGSAEADHTTAVAPNGLGVGGLLDLVSRDGGYTSSLRVDGSALRIGPSGTLQVSQGGGGPRSVDGDIINDGQIRIAWPATLGRVGGPILSSGGIAVAAGTTLTLPGGLQTSGGRIEGGGVLAGAMNGDATIAPGPGTAVLTIQGDFQQGERGVIELKIGGRTAQTQYDQLVLGGASRLAGTVRVLLANGFSPAEGDRFQIIAGSGVALGKVRWELPLLAAGLEWRAEPVGGIQLSVAAIRTPAGQFTGRVVDKEGHPVPGVTVLASHATRLGLLTEIWRGRDFSVPPTVRRLDANIDVDWGGGGPDPTVGVDNFAVRWTGLIEPRFTETYVFHTISDDGVRLWINDQLLIDNWSDHSATDNSGPISLVAGRRYSLRMEYYENSGVAVARLRWVSPSQALEAVPASQLFPPAGATDLPLSVQAFLSAVTDNQGHYLLPAAGGEWTLDVVGLIPLGFDPVVPVMRTLDGGAQTVDFVVLPLSLPRYPDLVAEAPAFTSPGIGGQELSVSWNTRNVGDTRAVAPWVETILLSSQPFAFGAREVGRVQVTGSLAPGGSIARQFTVVPPAGLTGRVYIFVRVDTTLLVNEGNGEANNVSPGTPLDLLIGDLVIESVQAPAGLAYGDSVEVRWVVRNGGGAAIQAGWSDTVRFGADQNGGTVLATLASPVGVELAPGGKYTNTAPVTVPIGAQNPPGTYYFIVRTDSGDQRVEASEANNQMASAPVAVTRPAPADLAVVAAGLPVTAPAGQPVQSVWTVKNLGLSRAVAPWVETLSLTLPDGSQPVLLARVSIPDSLDAGATITRTQQLILPAVLAGERRLRVTTDADDQVFESGDPANNTFTAEKTVVIAAPDLVVDSVMAVPGVFGQSLSFRWVVRNRGNGPAVGAWNDTLTLTGPGGTQVLPAVPRPGSEPIAPGGTYEQKSTTPAALSADSRPGDHRLTVVTDGSRDLGESDESNNSGQSGPFRIDLPLLPDLAVVSVHGPITAPAGEVVELIYEITNRGAATVVPPWSDSVSVAPADKPAAFRRLATIAVVDPLPPGATVTKTNRVTVPLDLAGDVRFTVSLDVQDQVFESDETNNRGEAETTSRVPLRLTLAVASDQVAEDVVPPVLRARITRSGPVATALPVTLASTDTGKLGVPTGVTIPVGRASVDVEFGVVHDGVVQGPKNVTLSAAADGFASDEATVTVLDADKVVLTLELSAPTITEGLSLPVTVRRSGPVGAALSVVISSGSEDLIPPATVVIGAGSATATFALVAADNNRLEGSRPSSLAASAPGVVGDSVEVTVLDNDDPGLVVTVEPGSISEGDGALAATGTVRRTRVSDRPLRVALASSNGTKAYVPPVVMLPAGKAAVSFPVAAINNKVVDGTQVVMISAQVLDPANGRLLAQATPAGLEVRDDDGPALRLSLGASLAREGRSPAFTAVVSRNTPTDADLTVTLAMSDLAEATAPASVVIKAGEVGAAFPVTTVDDGVVDGNKRVTLTATSPGFTQASAAFTVTDAQLPDLVVSEVRAPASGATGDLATFGYKISNQGFASFQGTIVQRIYLSTDPVLDAGDVLIDETPFTGTMLPGDSFDRSVARRLPLEAGAYHVIVVTDALDAIHETLEDNNLAVAAVAVQVAPAYSATVETSLTVAPSGTPVPMKGEARRIGGGAAVGELVNIHIRVAGTERIISALSDAEGKFATVFNPVPGEYGKYEIGASHPGVATAVTQDQFELLGLRANPVSQFIVVVPGRTNHLTVQLLNVNERALTALTTRVEANSGLAITVQAPPELSAGASGTATIQVSSLINRDATGLFTVRFVSAEGAVVDVGVQYNVELPEPRLVVNPAKVEVGMVRGRQTTVEIEVANHGGAESGPIDVTLPDLPWFRPASLPPYASIAPGATTRITFLLTPDATVPLQIFDGRFALGNDLARVTVPFTFRHVSDAVGDVRVLAEDELTYYGTNNVRVANAAVTLSDIYTAAVLKSGVTGPDGTLPLTDVREGTYNLEVSAPKHDSYKRTITIAPGRVNEFTAFLRTQLVRYSWKVEEIDIVERATVRLETIFETTVPVPVVTIEPTTIDLTRVAADEFQVDLKITNQGLIAAQGVKLNFGDGATWSVRTLSDDLGIVPAKSTLTVPVVFTRIHAAAAAAPPVHRDARPARYQLVEPTVDRCRKPSIGVQWELVCGRFGVSYFSPVAVIDLGLCPPAGNVTIARHDPFFFLDPFVNGARPGGVGGGGFGGESIGGGARGFVAFGGTNDCSCVKQGFQEACVSAEGGFKGEARGAVLSVINTVLPAYAKILKFETKFNGSAKLCTCCVEVDGQTVTGLKLKGEAGGTIEGKVLLGVSASTEVEVSVPGFAGAKAEVKGQLGLEMGLSGSIKVKAETECLLRNPKVCVEAKFTAKGFLGGKGSASISATPPGGTPTKIGGGEIAIGVESGLSASVEGCTATGFKAKACLEPVVFKAEGQIGVAVGKNTQYVKVGGSKEIFPTLCVPKSSAADVLIAYNPYAGMSDAQAVARLLNSSSPSDLARRVTGREVEVSSGATGRELSDALIRKLGISKVRTAGGVPTVVFEHSLQSDAAAAAAKQAAASSRRTARQAAGNNGICAQVRLLIEQQAVVTRKAIGATLEVVNESTDTPLQDLGVTIQIYDRLGNLANDRFVILDPELTRFQPMDVPPVDTYQLGGLALRLGPDTTGSARWVIVPKDEAAPVEALEYFVGGFMTYRVGNVVKTAEFTPGSVRVYPNAKLALKYFHQRDVFSDDPFTPEIEPSIPFVLGVMVQNKGRGVARKVSITSAQPKIVENTKGLLIDFDIIATEVAGKPLSPSLRADFGDIDPGKISVGRWLLKSSLQGLFLDYQATLVHDDRFGERGASVFEGVEIHEMIHQVEADRTFADGLPDFLVNDVSDPDDLPDTLHLSDGRVFPVAAVRTASNDGAPTADDLEVTLTAPMPSGWAYLRVADPGAGHFELRRVLRPDGSEVAMDLNVWVTDRTFIGLGRRPIREFNLHLLDFDSPGSYRLIYRRDQTLPDTIAPSSEVAALPATVPALIPVRWSGHDDPTGGGIVSYDLYVSVDNGPFSRWLSATRSTSSYYPGASGRRYAFYSVARDAAGNLEAAPGTPDTAAVATGNSAPILEPVPDVALDEGGRVELILHASDQDLPGDTLTYRMVSGPAGVVVDAASGRLTWQTGEVDGPALVNMIVSVTDDGTPALSSQQTVRILVREVNTAPRLVLPAKEFTVAEGNLLKFTASADDPDLPPNPLRYRLVGTVPAGATIQASTGEFRWQPSEAQGGAEYTIGIEVNDHGQPPYTDTGSIRVTVTKVNSAPIVTPVKNRVVHEGDLVEIAVQAVDHDLPPQVLKYVLTAGAATGARLDGATGIFVWTPGEADAPGTNVFSVLVSDDQVPPASSGTLFRITVRPLKPGLNLARRENSGEVSFRFKGQAGVRYRLEGSIDLKAWQPLQDFLAEQPIFTLIDRSSGEFPWRFFRARNLP